MLLDYGMQELTFFLRKCLFFFSQIFNYYNLNYEIFSPKNGISTFIYFQVYDKMSEITDNLFIRGVFESSQKMGNTIVFVSNLTNPEVLLDNIIFYFPK